VERIEWDTTDRQLEESEAFLEHLDRYLAWSGKPAEELCTFSKTKHEAEARDILSKQAMVVLRHQRAAARTAIVSEKQEQQVTEKKEFDDFLEKLDKLVRLSIADSDREPYFRRAGRALDEEEAELERRRDGVVPTEEAPAAA
jgi:hypothetical protein